MQPYTTIFEYARFEYEEKKSVFIGEAAPVKSEAEAIAFIESAKKRFPDAKHHVYAYVLRDNSIMRFSDDKEPQGTAGMPTLDVIRKRNCTDTVVVVTRYFGGTLLGTGGLVRAYTAATVGALEKARIITYDVYSRYEITVSYSDHGKISTQLSDYGFRLDDTVYSDDVCIKGSILTEKECDFEKKITEITSGRAEIIKIEEKFDF